MWSDTQKPHPKRHLSAHCQQLVPAFQRELVGKKKEQLWVVYSSCQVHPKVVETALGVFQSAMVYDQSFINSKLSLAPTGSVNRLMQSLYSKENILTRVHESGLTYISYFAFLAIR